VQRTHIYRNQKFMKYLCVIVALLLSCVVLYKFFNHHHHHHHHDELRERERMRVKTREKLNSICEKKKLLY